MPLKHIQIPLKVLKRNTSISLSTLITPEQKEHFPHTGNREIVGYGRNGMPMYVDSGMFPYPSLRWRSYDDNNLRLKVKEQGDWNGLTIEEKKQLYRLSFRQTFSEFNARDPGWKVSLSIILVLLSSSMWVLLFIQKKIVGDELPFGFTQEGKWLRMYKQIYMNYGHINGIASKWDYEKLQWKED